MVMEALVNSAARELIELAWRNGYTGQLGAIPSSYLLDIKDKILLVSINPDSNDDNQRNLAIPLYGMLSDVSLLECAVQVDAMRVSTLLQTILYSNE